MHTLNFQNIIFWVWGFAYNMFFSSNAVFPLAIWYSDITDYTEMVLNII